MEHFLFQSNTQPIASMEEDFSYARWFLFSGQSEKNITSLFSWFTCSENYFNNQLIAAWLQENLNCCAENQESGSVSVLTNALLSIEGSKNIQWENDKRNKNQILE